jgi:hypothetical protein
MGLSEYITYFFEDKFNQETKEFDLKQLNNMLLITNNDNEKQIIKNYIYF